MKTKKTISKVFVTILALFMAFSSASCAGGGDSPSLEKISFVLEWEPNTNHTGVYVAAANGYYEDMGLEVEILAPPETGASAFVASGEAEFGIGVQESLALELTLDAPLPVTAVASIISHNNSGIISLKGAGIDDFSKLEGKTYASWETPVEAPILRQTVEDSGGDFTEVKIVPAPATDAISMIQSGLADAVWVYESWDVAAAELAGVEYNFLKFADASPVLDFYTPLIIANNDFLESDPETVKKFLDATAQGYEYAIAHPQEAAQILIDAVPELTPELVFASQEFLATAYRFEGERWGEFDEARWNAFYDWMHEQGIIPTPLGSKGFTNEYLP